MILYRRDVGSSVEAFLFSLATSSGDACGRDATTVLSSCEVSLPRKELIRVVLDFSRTKVGLSMVEELQKNDS